jgi:glucans biosynthesis protein
MDLIFGDVLNRRELLSAAVALPMAGAMQTKLALAGVALPKRQFGPEYVRRLAHSAASKAFDAPKNDLPKSLQKLAYDQYRAIRFLPNRALWRGENLPFEVQFFHRGFVYANKVEIFEVTTDQVIPVQYRPEDFSFGDSQPPPNTDLGFAGFRLHSPINRPDYYDEFCVFLGASYFRAVAKGEIYGLSARGLSINTGQASGEEFPFFKAFWIEKPTPKATSIVVHALLDSKSAAAAYRFTIRPGDITIFDVEMSLYPRETLEHPGLAPMTSMFFFGPNDRIGVDDFRPSVHDSDGLAIYNGRGEQLWRPLNNPRDLQISDFSDLNPRGFGLMQRTKNFSAYQDLESRFEKRPSLWAEPIGDWGEGSVQLMEIPTKEEIHDNIASFWHPKAPLPAKSEHNFTYRLHWGVNGSNKAQPLARFVRTGIGSRGDGTKLFVLDLVGENLKAIDPASVKGMVSANTSEIRNVVTQPNPEIEGWRLSFELPVKNQSLVELRAALMQGENALSEIWIYRWTP